MLPETHNMIYADATDRERQLAEATGLMMQAFARLAERLSQGEWSLTRDEAAGLRDALAHFDALLPSASDELDINACRPELVQALLEAAGFPMPALLQLAAGDYAAFAQHARDAIRRDLVAYGAINRGRDDLLARSARVGIKETEAARLTGLSRNTVRKVIHAPPTGQHGHREPPCDT
ncbi:hypothetical protein [Streptomyces sp. MMBL 11-1]|uniref:hypothetical protein n=1 Tax=Streptomyces sp. MMBL 11-1 TaxID=3026420 RepID=UPI00235F631E|nr:hypothetical protein [Streptomyces sp. MMBL 11-1]